jgi:PAS domain S-box-containing protein
MRAGYETVNALRELDSVRAAAPARSQRRDLLGPIGLFCLLAAGVLAAWQFNRADQAAWVRTTEAAVARQLALRLESFIAHRIGLLEQTALLFEDGQIDDEARFARNGETLHALHPSMLNLFWIDPDLVIRWVSPAELNKVTRGMDLKPRPTAALLERMAAGQSLATSPFELRLGGTGFVVYRKLAPASDGHPRGYLGLAFRVETLVRTAMPGDLARVAGFALHDGDSETWRIGSGPLAHQAEFSVADRRWSLHVSFPAQGSGGWGLLALGLVLSLLVSVALHLLLRQRAALAESEQRFRDFAEAGSDWFWEMGPDLRFTWFSGNFRRRSGIDPARVLGKSRAEIGIPEDNPQAWQAHLALLDRHEPFQGFAYSLRNVDGTGSWTRTSGKPRFDAQGRFLGYRGASSICSDEMTALARAHQAEAMLHASLSAMADGFALYDARDRLVLFNDAFRALVAADPECFIIGTSFETMCRSYAKYLDEAKADPEGWVAARVEQHRNPRGPIFRALPNGRHIRVLERPTLGGGIVMVISDVTELHRREQEVAASEARYALAFRGANEGVWDWDLASGRIYGSERLWQLIGVGGPAGWRDGEVYTDLMHADDIEAYNKRVRAHFRGEAPVYEAEYRIVRPDGEICWIRSRGIGVKSADGSQFVRMAGSAADITAAKYAEFRLQRSEADLKAILDSARQAFVLLDRDGRVRAINRAGHDAARRLIGRELAGC